MSAKRIINPDFWIENKVVDAYTPEDKYFMLYLCTNPHTTQLGIYQFSIKVAAFEMGYSRETVIGLLDRFANKYGRIFWNKETDEVAIKDYLVYNIVSGGKPVADLLKKEIKNVRDKNLVTAVFNNLKDNLDIGMTIKEVINWYFDEYNISAQKVDTTEDNEQNKYNVQQKQYIYTNILDNNNINNNNNHNHSHSHNQESAHDSLHDSSFYYNNSSRSSCNSQSVAYLVEHILGITMSQYIYERAEALYEEVGEVVFTKALKKAAEANVRNFRYVETTARGIAEGNNFASKDKTSYAEKALPKNNGLTPEQQEVYQELLKAYA